MVLTVLLKHCLIVHCMSLQQSFYLLHLHEILPNCVSFSVHKDSRKSQSQLYCYCKHEERKIQVYVTNLSKFEIINSSGLNRKMHLNCKTALEIFQNRTCSIILNQKQRNEVDSNDFQSLSYCTTYFHITVSVASEVLHRLSP